MAPAAVGRSHRLQVKHTTVEHSCVWKVLRNSALRNHTYSYSQSSATSNERQFSQRREKQTRPPRAGNQAARPTQHGLLQLTLPTHYETTNRTGTSNCNCTPRFENSLQHVIKTLQMKDSCSSRDEHREPAARSENQIPWSTHHLKKRSTCRVRPPHQRPVGNSHEPQIRDVAKVPAERQTRALRRHGDPITPLRNRMLDDDVINEEETSDNAARNGR